MEPLEDDYYWGNVTSDSVEPAPGPVEKLKDAAERLGKQTNGLVTARVETGLRGEWIVHSMWLTSPYLREFAHRLFSVEHRLNPYPVTIPDRAANPWSTEAEK